MQTDLFNYKQSYNYSQNDNCPEFYAFGNHLGPCQLCQDDNKQQKQNDFKYQKPEEQQNFISDTKANQANQDDEFEEYALRQQNQFDELDQQLDDVGELFEQFANCECCHGYVYYCNGPTCKLLGECYCYHNHQNEIISDKDLEENYEEDDIEGIQEQENDNDDDELQNQNDQESQEEEQAQNEDQLQQDFSELNMDQNIINQFIQQPQEQEQDQNQSQQQEEEKQ